MMHATRRSKAHFDIWLTLFVFALAAFGVLSVSVATFSTDSTVEDTLLNYIVVGYLYKVSIEALFLPVTYRVIAAVKRREPSYPRPA